MAASETGVYPHWPSMLIGNTTINDWSWDPQLWLKAAALSAAISYRLQMMFPSKISDSPCNFPCKLSRISKIKGLSTFWNEFPVPIHQKSRLFPYLPEDVPIFQMILPCFPEKNHRIFPNFPIFLQISPGDFPIFQPQHRGDEQVRHLHPLRQPGAAQLHVAAFGLGGQRWKPSTIEFYGWW